MHGLALDIGPQLRAQRLVGDQVHPAARASPRERTARRSSVTTWPARRTRPGCPRRCRDAPNRGRPTRRARDQSPRYRRRELGLARGQLLQYVCAVHGRLIRPLICQCSIVAGPADTNADAGNDAGECPTSTTLLRAWPVMPRSSVALGLQGGRACRIHRTSHRASQLSLKSLVFPQAGSGPTPNSAQTSSPSTTSTNRSALNPAGYKLACSSWSAA